MFYEGEKVIVTKDIPRKAYAGIVATVIKVRPNLIALQWDKENRQLRALVPPKDILKYTEQEFKRVEAAKKLYTVASLEKEAFDVKNVIDQIKKFWDNASGEINTKVDKLVNYIKRIITEYKADAGMRRDLINGIKPIVGDENITAITNAISGVTASLNGIERVAGTLDTLIACYESGSMVSKLQFVTAMKKLEALAGDSLIPTYSVNENLDTIEEYTPEQKTAIRKSVAIRDSYFEQTASKKISSIIGEDNWKEIVASIENKDFAGLMVIADKLNMDGAIDKITSNYQEALFNDVKEKEAKENQEKIDFENKLKDNKQKLKTVQKVKNEDGAVSSSPKGDMPELRNVNRSKGDPTEFSAPIAY